MFLSNPAPGLASIAPFMLPSFIGALAWKMLCSAARGLHRAQSLPW
jgi:ABC-type Fe3+ transport system permease subunit